MQFLTILAGSQFRPATSKQVLKDLANGPREEWPKLKLRLERDPNNEFDMNAVKVIATVTHPDTDTGDQGDLNQSSEEHFIGFVARTDNRELAMLLDGDMGEGDSPLFADGHTPSVDRCEILDFSAGEIKPTIVIEVSTGFELGTLVKGDADGDGEDEFLPHDGIEDDDE